MDVLASINAQWNNLIFDTKEKHFEIRKTKPKIETPFRVLVYETKGGKINFFTSKEETKKIFGCGKVIGEFWCDYVLEFTTWDDRWHGPSFSCDECQTLDEEACLTKQMLLNYIGNYNSGYAWHITEPKRYKTPIELSEFCEIDKFAVRNCEFKSQVYANPVYTNGATLPGGFVCKKTNDWCNKCKKKALKAPPQSWRYAERISIND